MHTKFLGSVSGPPEAKFDIRSSVEAGFKRISLLKIIFHNRPVVLSYSSTTLLSDSMTRSVGPSTNILYNSELYRRFKAQFTAVLKLINK